MSWDTIKRRIRTSSIGSVLLAIFFIALIAVPLVILGQYFKQVMDDQAQTQALKQQIWRDNYDNAKNQTEWTYIPPDQPIPDDWHYNGFEDLYNQNRDFVGWLTIPETVVDYPVMQTKLDEEYYINRNFDREWSSSGSLFMNAASDARIPTDNIIIFGHHMQAGTMFGSLQKYYKYYDAYSQHKYIHFDTIWGDGEYEVVAAYYTTADDMIYDYVNITSESSFNALVQHISSKSVFTADSSLEYGDKFITLSTCAYHTQNGRFIVVAKRTNFVG